MGNILSPKLIIRNKNRYIYSLKSRIRGYIYSKPVILKNYLRLKENFIKGKGGITDIENSLFQKVYIETISYCNNDCAFCPASTNAGLKIPQSLMPQDLYMKVIAELSSLDFAGSIAFHCNNEPLLDKRLVLWINIARRTLKNNFFYLYTNGILINTDLTNQLFEAGLNRIIIDNYDDDLRLLPSVKDIIDNQSGLRGEVIINYRFKNEFLGNRAGQSPNAKFFLQHRKVYNVSPKPPPDLLCKSKRLGLRKSPITGDNKSSPKAIFLKQPLKIMCIRPSKEIVIGSDGTVPLCCADGLWKVVMGDVKTTALKDIWFSDVFKRVRKSLASGDRSCIEICKSCDGLNFSAPGGI